MNKDKMLEIIKENSFMKYNICKLIDQLKTQKYIKEYRDIIDYLEQVLGGTND